MLPEPMKSLVRQAGPALALLIGVMPALAATAPQAPAKAVHAEGCVQAGVEPRCLVLRDIKTGHLYDLIFKMAPPPVGLGIEFTGVLHSGPTHCMQGIAVEVTAWANQASIKCTPGQAGKQGRTGPQ
jgi:hypothetical protein